MLSSRMFLKVGGFSLETVNMIKSFLSYAIITLLLTGCITKRYIPVESFHTDSVYVTKSVHDTLRTLDSVYIHEKGDTVFYERWRTQYKSVLKTDTVLVTERDTIRVPYEVVKVEKDKPNLKTLLISFLAIAILIALVKRKT